MESRSGDTYNPHHLKSSPVFTMIVSSSGRTICRSPSTNLEPPVPPVRTVIMPPSEHSPHRQQRRLGAAPANRCVPLLVLRTVLPILDKPAISVATRIPSPRCALAILPDAARAFPD